MKNYLFFTLLSFYIFFSCSTYKSIKHNIVLTNKIDSILNVNNFNGVVFLSKNNKIIYHKAFGFSDFKTKIKLDPNDQFYIGSISKQITAVLVLKEVENGKIKLSDPINKYLNINENWSKKITIHHLLSHTHGILEMNQPLMFEPGSQFNYSQLGFGLLANILEKINEKSFEKISTNLFEDLGLSNTFHPDNKKYCNLVKGYEENEARELIHVKNNPVKYIAAGGFISNASDLQKWNVLLHTGKVLNTSELELMKIRYATRIHPILETIEYSYGLIFKNDEQNKQIGAFGYSPGFPTANYYYPQADYHLIVLGNTALNLNDFRITFKTQTDLMELINSIK